MKVAIWHQEDIHFEMLGYLIEYFQIYNPDVEFHIYVILFDYEIGSSYINFYNKFFNKKNIVWIYHEGILPNIEYDVIIMVSDHNLTYKNYLENKYEDKMISIEHWWQTRCPKVLNKVGTRYFYNRPDTPYAVPSYDLISKNEKEVLCGSVERIKVIFMGRFNVPSSTTFSFFKDFENIDIHFINWKIEYESLKYLKYIPNFYVHEKLETEEMIEIMKQSHFIFFYPNYIEGYCQHKTSASLHQAFSSLCIPIIPKSWNIYYNYNNNLIVEYDDLKFLTPNKQLVLSKEMFLEKLPYLAEERTKQIIHRNNVFDKMIKKVMNRQNMFEEECLNNEYIEKNIIQICIKPFDDRKIPLFVKENIKKMAPNYNYTLYNNDNIKELLLCAPEQLTKKYEYFKMPQHKKDLIQMTILYNFGGIYFDIDQEPLVIFDEIMKYKLKPTFVGMIPALKRDGLAVGFMGAAKNNVIVLEILQAYLNISLVGLEGGEYYIALCKCAGNILKKILNTEELKEGFYELNGERILLIQEKWIPGDYKSCQGTFEEKALFNSRYKDYPWDLLSN